MSEVFKPIPGFERYEVSNLGRVKSTIRLGRFLKPTIGCHGYAYVSLMATGAKKPIKQTVHRLVALVFIPNLSGRTVVNHIDGNKLNNDATNLEWCGYSENLAHAYDNGLNRNHGEEHVNSILTIGQVREIRRLREEERLLHREIAERVGTNRRHITKILSGATWRRA